MKRLLIHLIAGAALLLPSTAHAVPALPTASVQGTVVDKDHHSPLAGVLVSLVAENTPDRKSMLTDKSGNFTFKALTSGQYTIFFQKDGYDGLILTNLTVNQGEAVMLDSPLALHKSMFTMIDPPKHPNPCGSLVQPGQTADVYIVCADRR